MKTMMNFNSKIYGSSKNPSIYENGVKVELTPDEYRILKGNYNNANDLFDFLTNAREKEDFNALISAIIREKMSKIGKEATMNLISSYDKTTVYTSEGFAEFFKLMNVQLVNFCDPLDGTVGYSSYIYFN